MKTFKDESLTKLIYTILSWLIANKMFPRNIYFYQAEGDKEITAVVNFCKNDDKKPVDPRNSVKKVCFCDLTEEQKKEAIAFMEAMQNT